MIMSKCKQWVSVNMWEKKSEKEALLTLLEKRKEKGISYKNPYKNSYASSKERFRDIKYIGKTYEILKSFITEGCRYEDYDKLTRHQRVAYNILRKTVHVTSYRKYFSLTKRRKDYQKERRRIKLVKCALCQKRTKLELHHIVPLSKGGDDKLNNFICLCKVHHDLFRKESTFHRTKRKPKIKSIKGLGRIPMTQRGFAVK